MNEVFDTEGRVSDHGYSIDIKTDKEQIQPWIDFMFLNDNIAACIRSYCGQQKLSELEMYKMICVALIRSKYTELKKSGIELNTPK